MTRCLDERELYEMGDGRLPVERCAHVRECPECGRRLGGLRAMRAAMREATEPRAPDWDAVERRVLRAVRAGERAGASPVPRFAPIGLSFAAALLAALAIVVGMRPRETAAPREPIAVRRVGLPAMRFFAPEPRLIARVTDEIGRCAPERGAAVPEGASISAGCGGAILFALGDDISIDAVDDARLSIASLDAWRPTVRLDGGAFTVSVSDGALSPELVVLAAHEELALISGTAEVLLLNDELSVRAVGGPLLSELGGETRFLAPGEGLRRGPGGEVALEGADWMFAAASPSAAMSGVDSPSLESSARGTLPKSAVREVLRSNAEKMRVCYESALKRYPKLDALSVTARLKVAMSGRVARVRVGGLEPWPALEQCLVNVLGEMRFRQPEGGDVELIAPIKLKPRD
jgi:hypothetical protein